MNASGYLINDAALHTGQWKSLVVNEDCVIDSLLIDGVEVVGDMNYTGNTITATMYIRAKGGQYITGVELASGSVLMY